MGDPVNQDTKIRYQSAGGILDFAFESDFWIEKIAGLQTDISLNTSQSVGQRGATVNGQSVQPKKITVNGAIFGDVEANRTKILAAVLPLQEAKLTFIQNGGSWYLEGWPTKTPIFEDGVGVQEFQFQFYVPYPYFRSSEQRSYQLSGLRSMWHTPFYTGGRFYISKYTENAFCRVANTGNVAQAIVLSLYAAAEVTRPVVYNVEHSGHIRVAKVMAPGERMVISTHDKDKDAGQAVRFFAQDGSESNGFKYLAPDSDLAMAVWPGGNIFMADAAANRQNLRCTLTTAGGERHSI